MNKRLVFNLEPTFRCNLGCEMCPRFSSEDAYLDMSMETYARICEAMKHAHTVDYTGWGEPMLHKGIYEMIRLAGEGGCRTTMTSNGTILTEKNSRSLIEAGLDQLTVSIDGLRPETYDVIRVGASLEKVCENLKRLTRLVEEHGSGPQLGIAFTIQESNADDLPRLAEWTRDVGASVVHIKQLNVLSNAEDWERSFLKYRLNGSGGHDDRMSRVEEMIGAARRRAGELGLEVHTHSELPMTPTLAPRYCLAAPLDTVYFSYRGQVSPCCHFGHHVSRFFQGSFHQPKALFYGDIAEQSFADIWGSPAFTDFRRGFEKVDYPEECRNCYLLYGK